MPEHEGPARAVYDHTEEEPRRRRRPVADWGVGEELFDGMPGGRFERRGADHRIPRGGVDDGRRTIRIADGDVPAKPLERVDQEFASREEAIRARREHDTVWAGEEPFAERTSDRVRAGDEPFAAHEQSLAEERDLAAPLATESHRPADGIVRGGVEGRRTVKIGGQPAQFHSGPPRRRPVHERVGPRPDRIAAWAFALGLLLILIAIATANV